MSSDMSYATNQKCCDCGSIINGYAYHNRRSSMWMCGSCNSKSAIMAEMVEGGKFEVLLQSPEEREKQQSNDAMFEERISELENKQRQIRRKLRIDE